MSADYDLLLTAPEAALWLLDDNADRQLLERLPAAATVLSNRFELARAASARGLASHFADWCLPDQQRFPAVALRVGKERRVQQHLLRSAAAWLEPGGSLWLVGAKQEGVKTVAARAQTLGYSGALRKHGNLYLGVFIRPAATPELDDYHEVHPIGEVAGLALMSKPGVYGWDKIDRGSAMLVDLAQPLCPPGASLLDLGAGYGFLTLASASWPLAARTATDNNAAALHCVAENARLAGLQVRVAAGDCGDTLPAGEFDFILCNPPFHSGFAHDYGLTDRFAAAAARLLTPRGSALFVVNRFVPLPARAAAFFGAVTQLGGDAAYSVFQLSQPQPKGR